MTDNKEIAIKVENLTKSFQIPLEAHSGVKQKLINTLKGRKGYREFTPLSEICFEIEKGDFFGIVGRNGSGKSTLLKTLAGIYSPDGGAVHISGSLVPFIELGVGFNPELTGRENVFLNGALLGFSHKQMDEMYDDIIDFAELHDFMEERLKNYSSGMQVRLAFSIAIRAEGDILLLDEVLAVGDEAFQRKCFDYFEKLKRKKKTVILVTHDMAAIERFCTKALFLEEGKVKMIAEPFKVAAAYSRSNDIAYEESENEGAQEEPDDEYIKSKISVEVQNDDKKAIQSITSGEYIIIQLSWPEDIKGVQHAGVSLLRQSGEYVFGTNTYIDKHSMPEGATEVAYRVHVPLSEGKYFVKAGLFGKNDAVMIEFEEMGAEFSVNRDKNNGRWGGIAYLPHEWGS